jgi:hypothetical protein
VAARGRCDGARNVTGLQLSHYRRRTFDLFGAWSGKPPLGLPHTVVTQRMPAEWAKEGSPFAYSQDY